ncbi:hypothetical protein AVEN_212973-1 [Araneus ventricosus]|uniref:Pre-C2HC domain-containing protein n=1 Tax=Araneus ventricosus TaxID=182803 RepID=A0A4Y2MGS1_ARAVE|nr:hypothetical protein AVEN_212973-1 [Araneus ventricosus]
MLKRARKRLKKLNPNSEEGKKAMNEVERCNEEENIQKEVAKGVSEINLKVIANCNLILKEISQQFPKTENSLRRDFIGMEADTEGNRVLREAYEDRPVKVVIRDLPINIGIAEIIQSLEEKGYKIGRVSQMKNFKEKKHLPL